MNTVKVRIAPSPTGYLHIGTARTTLFNWLFAYKNNGSLVLRIEDTNLERSNKKYEENIIDSLKWLGLEWSEMHRQSERIDIYEKYLRKLLDSGKAFWCDHSKEELEKEQKEQMAKKEAPRHICAHKNEKRDKGQLIRLMVDENSDRVIRFDDRVRGVIEWKQTLIGDLPLAKNLREPLYNFAVVVDDIEMEITHIIRGEDIISNTPKQLLIYEALNIKNIPEFAHIPLILAPDRSKLSKRYGATAIDEFKRDYLPEALVNFIGFLGYTYNREILNKEDMASEFELSKVHKSGAVFDVQKLNWINSQYIRRLTPAEFKSLTGLNVPDSAVPIITERLEKLSNVEQFDYFWKDPEYDKNLLKWKKTSLEDSVEALKKVKSILEKIDFEQDKLRQALDELGKELGDRGLAYWPFRVALTGKEKSPDPVDIALVLGKEKTLERVKKAI